MKWLFIIWLILVALLVCIRLQVNVQWPAITADAQAPTATPTPVGAVCTITGRVFNPDGSPLTNGTVQFNSVVQQTLQGGAVIPPLFKSTNTDANGNIGALALIQGLQGQFTFCSPSAGGCGNPTPVLIPIAPLADISAILIGIQLSSGGQVVASSLDVTGNATIGGTLQVTGATTLGPTTAVSLNVGALTVNNQAVFNNSACFADGGCWVNTGINNVSRIGIGVPAPPSSLVGLQIGPNAANFVSGPYTDAGGNPQPNFNLQVGATINPTGLWIANVAYPMWYNMVGNQTAASQNGSENGWFVYGPVAIGQPIPGTAPRVQYMALRPNEPGVQAGLFIESGGIDILNGGITANGGALGSGIFSSHSQNTATFVQSLNADNNDANAAAVLRASNGLFVTDVGQTGGQANLGGFFGPNRGYLASDAPSGLLIEATGQGGGADLYLSAPNGNVVRVLGNQHFAIGNDGVSRPSVSSCGAGAQVAAYDTDNAGYVFTGSPAVNACVITFAAAMGTGGTPACVCTTQANTWCSLVATGSGFTMQFGTPIANVWVSWVCIPEG